jgi:hypothetical protein
MPFREKKSVHINTREESVRLRFGMVTDHQEQCMRAAKLHGILLGNWYHNIVDPIGCDMSQSGYLKGSCPNAELLARKIVNLPTRITKKQANMVVQAMKTI